jgi:hypothetical protein
MHHDSVMVLGTRIEIVADGELQTRELLSTRGFQSSSEQFLHFGLGHTDQIDKATVYWSNGKVSELPSVEINKVNEISYDSEASPYVYKALEGIVNVVPGEDLGLDFKQEENYFNDYDVQVLLPHKMSEPGQQLVVGDVNGDGLDDLFIPAPLGQANKLFIQGKDGKFESTNESVFQSSGSYEAVDAILIDIEKDGDQDIIVCAGGYQFEAGSDKYGLRLYTNDGAGNYREVDNFAPSFKSNCQSIESFDLEGDGDLDFFVGASVTPYKYPLPDKSGLFINDGDGHFNNLIGDYSSELETIGIVKDILWTDLEGDGKNELVLAGEWMPISVFTWEGNNLTNRTDVLGFSETEGWWNTVEVSDLNNDGRLDLIGGNLGLNYKYKSSADKPFKVYSKDFDNSGSYDIVLSTYYGDEIYPVRGKSCSSEQIPSLNEKFPTFDEYAKADLFDVYGDQLDDAYKREVYDFSSCIFYNRGGKFEKSVLPINAQIAPINGIVLIDFNEDGYLDLVLAGNLYQSEIETGRADMGTGLLMLNDKNEGFNCLSVTESGMYLDGDVKDLQSLQIKNNKKEAIIVHSNKDRVRIVTFK